MDRLVIGAGEVGQAMHTILSGSHIRDVGAPADLLDRYDAIHICVPWQVPDFVGTVTEYAEQYHAWMIVIHSTVPVGTCDPHGWVHNPIQGKHPNLATSIGAFRQHYGGARSDEVAESMRDFFSVGYQTHEKAATTEAAKLFSLAQYGMEITMQKEIHEFCMENNLPFEEVYTDFGYTYNQGWRTLGHHEFVKPILKHVPGPIGGHCVIPGTAMLPDYNFPNYVTVANESFQ